MADETPPAPPRRKRNKRAEQVVIDETRGVVVELFGHGDTTVEDPDGIRPNPNKRKPKHRKTAPRDFIRLSQQMTELNRRIVLGEITMKEVCEAMSPEELVRGRFKAESGQFVGPAPKWVPSDFHAECVRELLRRGQAMYRDSFLEAIEAFTEIARDKTLDAKDRLKAAQYIWERVEGKIPDRVEIASAQPWETIISGIVAEAEDEAISRASHILDGKL